MQTKHENTTVLNKQKTHYLRIPSKCWLNCHLASFKALLSFQKKTSTIQRHRAARSLFGVFSYKNVKLGNFQCYLFRITKEKCLVKNCSWSWNGAFLGTKKKPRRTSLANMRPSLSALLPRTRWSTGNPVSSNDQQFVDFLTINLNLAVSLVSFTQVHFNEICVVECVAGGFPLCPGFRC